MAQYNTIAESNNFIVLDDYEKYSVLNEPSVLYQTEASLEHEFIQDLRNQGYEYLPDLNTAIEYQGRQHYEAVEFFGGQEYLEYIQHHDKIKSEYCANNNIQLICIPYWENTNDFLNKILLI